MEIAIQTRGSYQELLKVARWAEAEGLAAIAVPDHYLAGSDLTEPAYDNVIHLAGLARETERIELVDLVSPITFRHPAIYAKTAVTLAEMSNGRFVLGLGTGWLEEEHRVFGFEFPSMSERFEMLSEALAYTAAFRSGEGFEGKHYRLEAFDSQPKPPFRVVVGGSGAVKTPNLTGRFADEFNLFPGKAGDIPARIAVCQRAAEEAGRRPGDVVLSYTTPTFAGTDEASYMEHMEKEAASRSMDVPELESRLSRRGIPYGFGEGLAERIQPIVSAGITRLYLQIMLGDITTAAKLVRPYQQLGV